MPKLLKDGWPETVGIRIPEYGNGPERIQRPEAIKALWKAYKIWVEKRGAWSSTVSDFIREAIWEKIERQASDKKGKG